MSLIITRWGDLTGLGKIAKFAKDHGNARVMAGMTVASAVGIYIAESIRTLQPLLTGYDPLNIPVAAGIATLLMAAFTELSLLQINVGNDPRLITLDLKGFTEKKLSSLGEEGAELLIGRIKELGLAKPARTDLFTFDLIRLMGESSQIFPLSVEGTVLLWCQKSYGPKISLIEGGWSEWVFRGYVQVKISQIPRAVTNIIKVAKERERQGKSTYFKYLLASFDEKRFNGGHYLDFIGDHSAYKMAEPVIAIYGDSLGMIQEILEALSEMYEWGAIESEYSKDNGHRREGTSAFTNSKGIEFRSLNYNEEHGNAEALLDLHGEGWRAHVQGAPTVLGGD